MLTRRPTRSATQFAAARNALMEASRRNAEAITAMGMVGRIAQRWSDLNRNYVARASARERRRRRPRRDVEGAAHDAAVRHARGRRLAGDQSAIDARHHHRRLDPRRPRAGAGRSRDRQLARFRRRHGRAGTRLSHLLRAPAGAGRADAAAAAGEDARRAERGGSAAGRAEARLPGRELLARPPARRSA